MINCPKTKPFVGSLLLLLCSDDLNIKQVQYSNGHHVFSPNGHSPNVHTPITVTPTYIEIYTFPDQCIELYTSPDKCIVTFPDRFLGPFINYLLKGDIYCYFTRRH